MKLKSFYRTNGGAAVRTLLLVCAVIVAVVGALQVWKGVKQMRGANRAEVARLLTESDQALTEGQRLAKEATPAFQQLLSSVDSLGLETFRAQQKEVAVQTNELIANAAGQFRLAQVKIDEAKKLNTNSRLAKFLELKSRSYDLMAQALSINQEMIVTVLDEAISTRDVLLSKLQAAAARRDDLDKRAQSVSNEATALGEELQANAKK